ncbi:MAG: hypothetical protein KatS3mg004_2945 [Bryobacteraceae bacterium]|nr:MAG: hypothetical protein KatS3mg004_2945 [Bryobacteraceae bacterium]
MNTNAPSPKPKRPLTEKELAARRANARKSTGPRSAEGKARSSKNAVKHGFFAQTALLYFESPDEFVALRDSYIAEYQPQGPTEMHFVMEMANAQFRLRRVRGMEADLIQHLVTQIDSWGFTPGELQAEALRRLADNSHVLALLQRYEVMFRRQYERALRLLWEHRDRLRRDARPDPPQPALRQDQRPPRQPSAPEGRAALLALQSLLAAPARLAEPPILQNEPKPGPNHSKAATSTPPRRPTEVS